MIAIIVTAACGFFFGWSLLHALIGMGMVSSGTAALNEVMEHDADASFKQLNAKMVKATGTVTEPAAGTSKHNVPSQQPPTMKVLSLKKVADGCN